MMHWRPGSGIDAPPAKYLWNGKILNSGKITTFGEKSVVSENRLTVIPKTLIYVKRLFGCAIPTAFGESIMMQKLK